MAEQVPGYLSFMPTYTREKPLPPPASSPSRTSIDMPKKKRETIFTYPCPVLSAIPTTP